MDKLQSKIEDYLKDKSNWKTNVIGQCKSWIKDGLKPRAMTRDLDWGVKVPIKDAEGKDVTVEQSKIDAARVELNKFNYQADRQPLYPPLEDFADAMYWNSKGDSSKLTAYYAACEKVKTDNPKPS